MNEGVFFARHEQIDEIAALWQLCFGERREAVDYFFCSVFAPEHCLVHLQDGQVAAMVHMLPGEMVVSGKTAQAHYIYAAATSPEHRSRGLMAQLLERAFSYGEERGDHYSFLLPSEPSLYDYYGRHGYTSYFKTRFVDVTREEVHSLVASTEPGKSKGSLPKTADVALMSELRGKNLADSKGSVLWPASYLDYALKVNQVYGGDSVSVTDSATGASGYALYSAASDGGVEISELFSDGECEHKLLEQIEAACGAERYRIRLPEASSLFPGVGTLTAFGMARPLGRFALPDHIATEKAPFLGLTLD